MTRFEELQHKQASLLSAYGRAYQNDNVTMMTIFKSKLDELQRYISNIPYEKACESSSHRYNHICSAVGISIISVAGNHFQTYKEVYKLDSKDKVTWGDLLEHWKGGN